MEGLIPFFIHAIKKPKPHNKYNRSKSELSNRSYHLLNAEESFSGSSHRRTRSEFQPPAIEFVQQRPGYEYNHSSSVHKRSTSASSVGSYPSQVPNKANNFTAIHCWCKSFPFFIFIFLLFFFGVCELIDFVDLCHIRSIFFVVYKWWRPIKLHQNDGSPSIVLLYFRYCCWIVCNGNCICHYLLFRFCLHCSKFGIKRNRRKAKNTRNYFCFIFLGLLRRFNLPVVY